MKLENITIVNEAGETGTATRADYIKLVLKENEVKPLESEENGTTPAEKIVNYVLKAVENGQEIDGEIASEYGDLIKRIEADVERTSKAKDDKKKEAEEAKAKKEQEKKEREEAEKKKAEELKLTQAAFVEKVAAGADLAAQEFAEEIKTLSESLPEGVKIVQSGSGFGIEFGSDASKETVGQTLGYVMQKADNSSFIGNQLHFWLGDTISVAVARGFYSTAREAANHISEVLSTKAGKKIQAPSLDQYKRMAERTPIEYRNAKVDPTAYLAISAAKAPRKGEGEKDEEFKKRLENFNSDVADIQKKLAVGEISTRKETLPLVNTLLVKHGMKKEEDPNAPQISVSAQMAIVFHTTFALESLVDVHKEGLAIYKDGDTLHEVSREELEEKRSVAMGHLMNILYKNEKLSLTPADYIRGYVEKTANVKVADGQDGKPVMEQQTVKNMIYPVPFWSIEKTIEAEAPVNKEGDAAPAEAPAEVKGKKGK